MAQKFPYEKAAIVIAEADIFGDKYALEKWGINRSTLWRWRDRAQSDFDLHQNATLKKRMLLAGWQEDATNTIKIALSELNRRIPLAATEDDARMIHAISGALKVVGELKIGADVISGAESS